MTHYAEPPEVMPSNVRLQIFGVVVLLAVALAGYYLLSKTPDEFGLSRNAKPRAEAPGAVATTPRSAAPAASINVSPPTVVPLKAGITPYKSVILDLPSESGKTLVPRLKAAAIKGDAKSAYMLYRVLADCARFPKASALWAQEARNDPTATQREIEDMTRRNAATTLMCEGVAPKDTYERVKWAEAAAAGGNEQARIYYGEAILDDMADSPVRYVKDPDELYRVRSNALQYLASAASEGSVRAMMELGRIYDEGIWTDRNPVLAYAYNLAGANSGLSRGAVELASKFQEGLTPDQVASAKTVASSLSR